MGSNYIQDLDNMKGESLKALPSKLLVEIYYIFMLVNTT
jgi:hypothetical protein